MIIESLCRFVGSKSETKGRLRQLVHNYRRDESGAMLIFGLMLLICMLIIGGFAVNMMRYERVRVDLAQTLDRAALAAASLSQTLNPEDVVKDYMKKADMLPLLKEVKVTATANGRIVEANARVDVPFFMAKMIGVDDLPAYAGSKARQDITDLEIMLVLDISGSMGETDGNGSTKIAALRKAAKEFVAQMITADSKDHISIGIVPYNAQVNLGPKLISRYTVDASAAVPNGGTLPHGRNDIHCLDLPDAAFAQRGISRTDLMYRMARSDTLSGISDTGMDEKRSADLTNDQFFCGPYNTSELATKPPSAGYVMMPTSDTTVLNNKINSLWASGNTSITLGMKWGVALIDPSAETIYDYFVGTGDIPSVFADRPFAYDKEDSLKVIVLMTDGTHVAHSRIKSPFNAGMSPIYKDSSGNYALRVEWSAINGNTNLRNRTGGAAWSPANVPWYFLPHLQSSWSNSPTTIRSQAWRTSPGTGAKQLSWAEVWAELTPQWVAWHLYARGFGGNDSAARSNTYNDARWTQMVGEWKSVGQMDAQLQATCTLAKTAFDSNSNPVVVFGIAFNAPSAGETQIKNCATKPTEPYFFKVEPGGMTISEAFSTIGSTINNLRLTQ
ncbi:TadE/TadG family type IV pilus assembly protein [Neogemmobacter tilapiae]|uniref:VWFA domain-containing protein n=1 Tax=Neogemmobacter tilapiae TaxID=875041 RepID=A0A918TMG7_9RHOB|nr:vWA domain-containing protein [Gemmobacter tilapiae]GHC54763.1 hypothetical protein GCM10007315_17190 [Gemmobacter tilapiae]